MPYETFISDYEMGRRIRVATSGPLTFISFYEDVAEKPSFEIGVPTVELAFAVRGSEEGELVRKEMNVNRDR